MEPERGLGEKVVTTVLGRGAFSVIERPKPKTGKGRPKIDPQLFARVDSFPESDPETRTVRMHSEWGIYVSIIRDGDFRRLPLSLPLAKQWLTECLGEVDAAMKEQKR